MKTAQQVLHDILNDNPFMDLESASILAMKTYANSKLDHLYYETMKDFSFVNRHYIITLRDKIK